MFTTADYRFPVPKPKQPKTMGPGKQRRQARGGASGLDWLRMPRLPGGWLVSLALLGQQADPAARAVPPADAPKGTLTIGAVIALTGNANLYGQDQRMGLSLARPWAALVFVIVVLPGVVLVVSSARGLAARAVSPGTGRAAGWLRGALRRPAAAGAGRSTGGSRGPAARLCPLIRGTLNGGRQAPAQPWRAPGGGSLLRELAAGGPRGGDRERSWHRA
jgi:hypothetical protein